MPRPCVVRNHSLDPLDRVRRLCRVRRQYGDSLLRVVGGFCQAFTLATPCLQASALTVSSSKERRQTGRTPCLIVFISLCVLVAPIVMVHCLPVDYFALVWITNLFSWTFSFAHRLPTPSGLFMFPFSFVGFPRSLHLLFLSFFSHSLL